MVKGFYVKGSSVKNELQTSVMFRLTNCIAQYSLQMLVVGLVIFSGFTTVSAQIKDCDSPCNMIKNGDFSMGNVGFTSGLTYRCNACQAGNYCVGPLFNSECNLWPATGGNPGNFLIVDGSNANDNVDVWKKTVKTCKGVTYTFSFQAKNVYTGADAVVNVGMMIDGNLKQTAAVNSNTGWTTYSYSFTATGSSCNLALRQLTKGQKRDFGIDNVFFGFCSCTCTPD